MARYVDDLYLTLPPITGVDWRDPAVVPVSIGNPAKVNLNELRVSFYTNNGIVRPTRHIVETVRRAALLLDDACAVVEDAKPGCIEQTDQIYMDLFTADGGASFRKQLDRAGTTKLSEQLV